MSFYDVIATGIISLAVVLCIALICAACVYNTGKDKNGQHV
jgi:hypothetical protein